MKVALVHWFFTRDSTTTKTSFYHKTNNHYFQILVYYPNVLAKNLKGQVPNFGINISHPLHMDISMLAIKQRFESLKTICCKIKGLIKVHVIKITLTNFDGCHKVIYKYVPHLGKLDENMH